MNTEGMKQVIIRGFTFYGTEEPIPNKEQVFFDGNGGKYCFMNGEFHCSTGPAIESPDGSKEWRVNGKLHNLNGPAAKNRDGSCSFYIDGELFTIDEFDAKIEQMAKKSKTP